MIVVAIGVVTLVVVHAATYFSAIEVESGTVSGPAVVVADSTATQGKYIKFMAAETPTTPTTPPPTTTGTSNLKSESLHVFKPGEWAGRPGAIYDYQVGKWYGNWINDVKSEVNSLVTAATAKNQLALFVTYNIPGRDCGSYSAGGAGSSASFRTWMRSVAAGIGQRKAIIVVEPDALAQLDCLSTANQAIRLADISDAVTVLKSQTKAYIYIDGGNSTWQSAATMVDRLKKANVANATGFSLNVSNFNLTTDTATYGDSVTTGLANAGVSGKRYVIDTSRNGKGAAAGGEWCNPAGRGLGKRPSTAPTIGKYSDAYLWIKTIGESDGPCNGGPAAGGWFPAYAQALINNAVY